MARVLPPGGTVAYRWKCPAPDTPWMFLVDELLVDLATVEGSGRAVFEHPVPYTLDSYVGTCPRSAQRGR